MKEGSKVPRRGQISKRDVLPDPLYGSKLVTKLINNIMLDGKKGVAQKIVYDAFKIVEEKTGMNGLEATIKIKEVSPSTKIIILTSHERNEEVIAALGSGANAYCLKDITPETLSSVIKNVAEGACWVDAAVSSAALNFFPKPENVSFISTNEVQDARAQLTERELEVLKHLVKGKSNTEIAKELIVSVHTAKAHVCSILQKLCVDDRVQAAVKAIKENII